MNRNIVAPIAAGVLLALAGSAHAAQKSASFEVSATVVENCTITAGNLAFGTWFGDTDLTASSTISVECTTGTDYVVNLNGGATSGNVLDREMSSGGPVNINYNLYTDSNHQNLWGDGTGSTFNAGGIGSGIGSAQNITVYGRLLASQNTGQIEAGSYVDLVTATIVY